MMSELRLACRSLLKQPGFSLVMMATLALGTGVNVAIFSLVEHALLRTLPVPEPERLVNLSSPGPKTGATSANSGFGSTAEVFSHPLMRDIERVQPVFTHLAAHRDFPANVVFEGRATTEAALFVSGGYFPALAMRPALGRLLGPADDRDAGASPVVVVSHDYWRTQLNADPAIIGASLIVNGQAMTIVGVGPPEFVSTTLDHRPHLFVPLVMAGLMVPSRNGFDDREDHWLYLFGRLKPGMTLAAAEQTINIPFSRLITESELPAQRHGLSEPAVQEFARRRLELHPGSHGQRPGRESQRQRALLLFAVTASVLLIACVNAAHLMMARGVSRAPELAVRAALGAGRSQMMRSLLIESAILAVCGTALGVLLGFSALGGVLPLLPGIATYTPALNIEVLLFAAVLVAGMVLLVGLYPAWTSTGPGLMPTLQGQRNVSGPTGVRRVGGLLTTTQVGLSLALVITAGLFAKSLLNVSRLELGIQAAQLLTFRVSPELNGYTPERAGVLAAQVERAVTALPGVTSVSLSTIPLFDGFGWSNNVTIDRAAPAQNAHTADVGPGYFRTVGTPLLMGREFASTDRASAPKVAIVNESFVRAFELGPAVIGRRIGQGAGDVALDIEIVGVARDARYSDVKTPASAQFYLCLGQSQRFGAINVYIRSTGPLETLLPGGPLVDGGDRSDAPGRKPPDGRGPGTRGSGIGSFARCSRRRLCAARGAAGGRGHLRRRLERRRAPPAGDWCAHGARRRYAPMTRWC